MVMPGTLATGVLPTPSPNPSATQEPLWGSQPGAKPDAAKPGETPPETPPGASKVTAPKIDLGKAKETMLGTLDNIIKQSFAALGLEYKPPTHHADRVGQAAQVVSNLTGKPRDDFLQAMESAGKPFGINCGLKRGEGTERKALNFGDAAFKGVDGAQRQKMRQDLQDEPKPSTAAAPQTGATPAASLASKPTPTAGSQLAEAKEAVATKLLPALGFPATKADYSAEDVKKLSAELEKIPSPDIKRALPALQAGLAELASQPESVGKETLVDFLAKALLTQPAKQKKEE